MHFGSLIVKFLDQRVDLMPVPHTDQLINDICQMFFQHEEHDVVRLFVVAATLRLCWHGWSPSVTLLVTSRIHGPQLKMAKK
jgi:hypothetical protein